MERQPGPFSDRIGRMMGFLGILLATGGPFYLYRENQELKKQIRAIQNTIETSDSAKNFNNKWNTQLVAALEDFKTRANDVIEKDIEAQSARNHLFLTELANLPIDTADVEAIVDQRIETLRKVAVIETSAQLRVARNGLKPNGKSDANITVIANDGDLEAEIKFVSFRPIQYGQFEVNSPLKIGSNSANDWVIRFLPADNTTTKTGHQHHYKRPYLLTERTIPAKRSVHITVEIENSKHIGWGLEGDLIIEYADGKTLDVPDARAVFVASDADSA